MKCASSIITQNRGYGGALRTGFASATKEWIFYTDGDAQYDPRELKNLAALVNEDVDFINGWKIERNDPAHRIIIGRVYQYVIKAMFGLKLKDVDCDFRLMRRRVFDKVELTADSGVICVELMKKVQDAGFRLTETPVHHFHRAYGKSQFFNYRPSGARGPGFGGPVETAGARQRASQLNRHTSTLRRNQAARTAKVRLHARCPD